MEYSWIIQIMDKIIEPSALVIIALHVKQFLMIQERNTENIASLTKSVGDLKKSFGDWIMAINSQINKIDSRLTVQEELKKVLNDARNE